MLAGVPWLVFLLASLPAIFTVACLVGAVVEIVIKRRRRA